MLQRNIPALDGIRIFAAVSVVAFHENVSVFKGGFLGVDIFFVLSGMLTATILLKVRGDMDGGQVAAFVVRRFWRLWPLMAFVVATVMAVLWILPDEDVVPDWASLTFLSNFRVTHWDGYYWFRHFWSLSTEMQFYILLGIVFWLTAGQSIRAFQAFVIAGFVIGTGTRLALVWSDVELQTVYYHPLTHSTGLFVGAYLATVRFGFGRWNTAVSVLAVATIAVCLYSATFMSKASFVWFTAIEISAALLILALRQGDEGPVARFLSLPPIRQLGIWSYGIYLWHFPISLLTPSSFGAIPSFALTLVLSILLSAVSFYLVEDRFRNLGRRTG